MQAYFFKLCWKNIWRNKRRTFLTVNAIGLGVMALVFLHNYYDTFHDQMIANVIRYHSGHLAVSSQGFEKNKAAQLYLKDTASILDWFRGKEAMGAYSERVFAQGLVSSAKGSVNVAIMGVRPTQEAQVTQFAKRIVAGDFFAEDVAHSIVIGSGIKQSLGVELGSKIVVLTQGVDGSVGNELFFVRGIFETGSDADKTLAFVNLKDARALLSLSETAAHQIAIVLKNEEAQTLLHEQFQSDFKSQPSIEIYSWKELQRPIVAMIELDRAVNRLLMVLILGVAAIGIANSILMSIMERTREFGVMLAIGTSRGEVVSMVVIETILLTIVGVLIGNLFGILLTTYFHKFGFDLRWFTSKDFVIQGTLIQTVSYPVVRLLNSLMVTGVILGLSLIVSFFPARLVGSLTPVKALRSV